MPQDPNHLHLNEMLYLVQTLFLGDLRGMYSRSGTMGYFCFVYPAGIRLTWSHTVHSDFLVWLCRIQQHIHFFISEFSFFLSVIYPKPFSLFLSESWTFSTKNMEIIRHCIQWISCFPLFLFCSNLSKIIRILFQTF